MHAQHGAPRLIEDHQHIVVLATSVLRAANQEQPDVFAASDLLFELAVHVASHLGFEDEMIDLGLLASESGRSDEVASDLLATVATLRRGWTRFIARWSPDQLDADWPGFQRETRAMLERLVVHVRLEDELLHAAMARLAPPVEPVLLSH